MWKICFLINRIRIKLFKDNLPLLIAYSDLPEAAEENKYTWPMKTEKGVI